MNPTIAAITVAMSSCLSGCEDRSSEKDSDPAIEVRNSQIEQGVPPTGLDPFPVRETIELIEKINISSYENFLAEWATLGPQLGDGVSSGAINKLAKQDRERLWWTLEEMRACSRPEIFEHHNEEIIPLLLAFDLPELNDGLRKILVDSGQLSK